MTLHAVFTRNQNEVTTSELFQWDIGQQLCIEGLSGIDENTEVHFANNRMIQAIVKTGTFEDNALTVDIPNEFLQSGGVIHGRAWVYVNENTAVGQTIRTINIPIVPRTRPNDYVSPADPDSKGIVEQALEILRDGTKVSYVTSATVDNATENGKVYYTTVGSSKARIVPVSGDSIQVQFRLDRDGKIYARRRSRSSTSVDFPAWGAFEQIGWKHSEIDDMIATYLASVKSQTITAQSTHDQIPTAKAVYDYAADAKATGNEIKADAALVAGESLITASLLEPYNATFTNVEYTTTANKTLMADGTIIDYNAGGVSNVVVLTPDTLYECNCAGIGGGGAYFFLYDKNDNISAIYPAIDTDSKNFVFKASDKFKKIQFNVRGSGCYLRAITLNGLEVENNFIELTNHILDTVDYTRLNISFIESKLLNNEGVVQDYAGGGTTWTVSNEIDISQYDYLKINARTGYGNAFFAIYDENHNPIYVEVSPNSAPSIYNANVILPENAHYLIISKYGTTFDAYVSYPVFEAPAKKWEGKKWVCIGDSLTEANSATSKHYFDYIADETGITTANYGIGGTGYANPSGTAGNFTARMASVPTDADVYTIFGSFNDYAYSINNDIPIGTPEDSGTSTICGYINSAFDALFARVPLANLGVVAPCPWVSVNSVTGTASKTFAENYVSALRQCCERKSIPFLDLYHGSGLRPWDSNFRDLTYTKDTLHGVHPDETGHAILAPKFSAFLESLLSRYGIIEE